MNPKDIAKMLAELKRAYQGKFTPGYYHASPNPRIKAFDPYHEPNPIDGQSTPRGATFLTRDPNFAESYLRTNAKGEFAPGSTIYPVSVNMGKHFDPHSSPEAQTLIQEFVKLNPSVKPGSFTEKWHNWTAMENPAFNQMLRDRGYDTFAVTEGGVKNIGVLDPKNIRGKFAQFNPEAAESADFMKAEGGLAHLAAGGKTPAWQRKEGKNPEGGLNAAGRASYNRETGGNLKAPQPEGGARRDSFCARMKGMKKKLTSAETANDPDSRINKSLRKWKC